MLRGVPNQKPKLPLNTQWVFTYLSSNSDSIKMAIPSLGKLVTSGSENVIAQSLLVQFFSLSLILAPLCQGQLNAGLFSPLCQGQPNAGLFYTFVTEEPNWVKGKSICLTKLTNMSAYRPLQSTCSSLNKFVRTVAPYRGELFPQCRSWTHPDGRIVPSNNHPIARTSNKSILELYHMFHKIGVKFMGPQLKDALLVLFLALLYINS